jgi:hypothetical protein
MVTTATLVKWVREPCSGEVHLPREEIKVMSVIRYLNLDRTLLRVSWQTGGECLVFPEELEEQSGPVMYFSLREPKEIPDRALLSGGPGRGEQRKMRDTARTRFQLIQSYTARCISVVVISTWRGIPICV